MPGDKQRIESYLHELEQLSPLTEEETRQLMESRAVTLQRILKAHLHLVVPIADEFAGQGRSQVDLVLKGNVALTRAVEAFDSTTAETFSSYAKRSIRAALAQNE